jgi:Domain of Unknown Function (DUF928)
MGKLFWKKLLNGAIVLLLIVSLWFSFQPPAHADILRGIIQRVQTLLNPGSGRKAPTGRQSGGAGRGPLCPAYLNLALQAIVPTQSGKTAATTPELVWGKTTEAQPTLWFYVPHSAAELKTAKFVLLDANQQPVASPILLSLQETPGIVAVHLPVPLTLNQSYNWFFSIVCSTEKPSRNPSVRGWIERVEPSPELLSELQSNDAAISPSYPQGVAYRTYAEQGIWYDMVTNLIQQRQAHPTDPTLQADWSGFVNLLNAPALQDARLVRCCEPDLTRSL